MRPSRLNGFNGEEKHVYLTECFGVYLHNFLLLCDSYLRLAPFRLNAIKHCFSKGRRGVHCFSIEKMPRLFGVALFRSNAMGYCVFRKSTAALILVRLLLRAAFFRIAFAGFTTLVASLYFI